MGQLHRVKVADCIECPESPKHGYTKADIDAAEREIKELDSGRPLIAYEDEGKYIVIGGIHRLRALRALNSTDVWLYLMRGA